MSRLLKKTLYRPSTVVSSETEKTQPVWSGKETVLSNGENFISTEHTDITSEYKGNLKLNTNIVNILNEIV